MKHRLSQSKGRIIHCQACQLCYSRLFSPKIIWKNCILTMIICKNCTLTMIICKNCILTMIIWKNCILTMNDNLLLSLIEGHQSISRNQDPFNVQTESFESRFDIKDHEKTPSFGQKSSNQRHHKKNNRITTNLTTRT